MTNVVNAIDDIFVTLEKTFKGFPIEWKKYASDAKRIYNSAKHQGKWAATEIIRHQEFIVNNMRRVRFEGLNAARAKRNIDYHRREMEAIFEGTTNIIAWETARAWSEASKVFIGVIVGLVKGLITKI